MFVESWISMLRWGKCQENVRNKNETQKINTRLQTHDRVPKCKLTACNESLARDYIEWSCMWESEDFSCEKLGRAD